MAKARMMCPFSNKLCEECALYRGRHYYLCFCEKYRGYAGETGEVTKVDVPHVPKASSKGKFEVPPVITTSAIDPFAPNREKSQEGGLV